MNENPSSTRMHNAEALLSSLQDEGVQLWCEGAKLRYRAPKGRLAPEFLEALTACKAEIVELLSKPVGGSRLQGREAPPAEEFPLSFAQQRMWFLRQLEPESCALNVAMGFLLSGRLDVAALRRSLGELIVRHEVFRTTCVLRDGVAVQVIAPPGERAGETVMTQVDLRAFAGPAQELELRRLAETEARRPFDLESLPLLRSMLFQLAEDRWALLLTTHHFVIDGWSVGVLFRELSALYNAQAGGRLPPRGEAGMRYCDYALWQRKHLSGSGLEALRSYWKEQLAGTAEMNLPSDRPAPAVRSGIGAVLRFELPGELREALKVLSRTAGVSMFTTLLAAFKTLLHRYCRQDDIVVGTTVSDRPLVEAQTLVGCFANTLVLRTQFAGNPSFLELLHRVRETSVGAFDHQDMPFEMLVAELRPERPDVRDPILQAWFVFHQYDEDQALNFDGVDVRPLPIDLEMSRFDVLLELQDEGGRLSGFFDYNADLFDGATILRIKDHYQNLLEAIVADPSRPVSDLPMLSARERHQILSDWGSPPSVDARAPGFVHQLFEAQVERDPSAVAMVLGDRELTYGEVNLRADHLAHCLMAMGVGPEDLVGIALDRSFDMVVALLATLKAGGAFLPLDVEDPPARLAQIFADSNPKAVIGREALRACLPEGAVLVAIDGVEGQKALAGPPCRNPVPADRQRPLRMNDAAYVIYTSGSSGIPKGVLVDHAALAAHSLTIAKTYELRSGDRVMQFAALNFDAAVEQIFPALISGAAIVIRGAELWSSLQFQEEIDAKKVTVIDLPPAYWKRLCEDWAGRQDEHESCTVRLAVVGGEAFPAESLPFWQKTPLRKSRLLNAYGPTEATVTATILEVPPGLRVDCGRVSIGRPLPGRCAYVLDEALRPVPVGVPGELFLGGEALARGYVNRPALTEDRFLVDPFCKTRGGRMYRTGDLARWSSDGALEFLGRVDRQVKLRGFRVELGEIEAALREANGVAEAVAVMREDSSGERRLVAYLAGEEGLDSRKKELRDALKARLPAYLVPAVFVAVKELPRTSAGKVDMRALPFPEIVPETGLRAPRTFQEESLCGLFGEILGVREVGIDSSFFDLGGHSLLVMQLVSRVRSLLGVDLAVRTVFEAPTVAELAARLPGEKKTGATLARQDRPARIPLSFAQERLWWLHQLDPSSAEYNLCESTRLDGDLDVSILRRVLDAIVARHEILRTRFASVDGEPCQVIEAVAGAHLDVEDLAALGGELRDAAVTAALHREAETPFDLEHGPLFRARLLKLSDQNHIFLWTIHHAATDGWSGGVFQKEFSQLYRAFRAGGENPLPPLEVQYSDYAIWQRKTLHGEELARQLAFWKGRLTGFQTLELPADRSRPERRSAAGDSLSCPLPEAACRDLRQVARSAGATPAMLVLSALNVLLARQAGMEDIMVGLPVAGRNCTETESLIGFFANTVVLRTLVEGNASFREVLEKVRTNMLEAYARQETPFAKVVETLNPERSLHRNPFFEVFFNYFSFSRSAFSLPGIAANPVPGAAIHAKFPLTLYVEEQQNGQVLYLTYQTDLFTDERARHLLDQLVCLLEQIAREPDRPVSSYSLVTARARPLLPDPRASLCAQELKPVPMEVLAAAARNPAGVAVSQMGRQWTFQELANAAKRVAGALTGNGLRAGEVVAVSGPPSFGLISGILGVSLARGVLLMLDPALPMARRDVMVKAAGARHWLDAGDSDAGQRPAFQALVRTRISRDGACEPAPEASREPVELQDPAYIFFTSGTTGAPKGILGTHEGLAHFIQWEAETLRVGAGDRVAQLTCLSFDVVLRDIFLPLASGATLCLPGSTGASNDVEVVSWMHQERISILHAVPSRAQAWLDALKVPQRCPSLRWVLFAGEPLSAGLVKRWREMIGAGDGILNLYGPTETTLAKFCYHVPEIPEEGIQPVGRALPGAQGLILNRAGRLCGIGEPGEIVIRTPFRTLGYLGNRDGTGFVENPFTNDPTDLLYRSGDAGSYDNHGLLRIDGRLDDQVKIRGIRIEPGEVAAALSTHADIEHCAVVGRDDELGHKYLAAYYVPRAGTQVSVRDLRMFLKQSSLIEAMIPTSFVRLDALPLTANGKLDRKALPLPEADDAAAAHDCIPPRTETEETLARIWKELIRRDEIGVEDDFFEAGGHSLVATRLVSRILKEFDVDIPLREIFENPTIAALALRIEGRRAGLAEEHLQQLLTEVESLSEETADFGGTGKDGSRRLPEHGWVR